jgi:hypothetical protein
MVAYSSGSLVELSNTLPEIVVFGFGCGFVCAVTVIAERN